MRSLEKENLLSDIRYTANHVKRANELIGQHKKIHNIPLNSLTAIAVTLVILLFFWLTGFMSTIFNLGHDLGRAVANIEVAQVEAEIKVVADTPPSPSATDNELDRKEEIAKIEKKPLLDISLITNMFNSQQEVRTSAVVKYALMAAFVNTVLLIGLAVGLTYAIFYGIHFGIVKRNEPKLKQIVEDLDKELEALKQSNIPEAYWHIPYLTRMEHYLIQNRADDLREVLELVDLDIRHQQIVDALLNRDIVDARVLSESVIVPSRKNKHHKLESTSTIEGTNLAN